MEKLKYCRFCGKKIDERSNFKCYCSDWCRQHWNYEVQEDLFYVPGMKQDKSIVCGRELLARQLKYCSRGCCRMGTCSRKKAITVDDITSVKQVK